MPLKQYEAQIFECKNEHAILVSDYALTLKGNAEHHDNIGSCNNCDEPICPKCEPKICSQCRELICEDCESEDCYLGPDDFDNSGEEQ